MLGLSKELKSKIEKHKNLFFKVAKGSLKWKDEEVLIISDYGEGENNLASMLAYGYYVAAKKKGLEVNLLFQGVKKGFMFADNHVVDAIKNLKDNNIVILCLSNKFGRFGEEKSFGTFCKSKGHKFLSATGLGDVSTTHFKLFLEAMSVNYNRMQKKGKAIKKIWDKAKEIRVKTDAGTDLVFDVTDMEAIANVGDYHEPGRGGNMPAGEVYIPPRGLSGVNGILVIDGSVKTMDGAILLKDKLTLEIKDGKVIRMEGEAANLLEKTFQNFENRAKYPERVRLIGELAIGINPAAVLIGSMIMDEKVLGTGHVAIGSNYWFGGEIKTIFHGDMVFKSPTYYVDGVRMKI